MYSDKQNINILTQLLSAHGVTHAVVCPGSRNAPIVNNLNQCAKITCLPVTDERSAGFYALGIALLTHRPTVVCVTSGSALLNLAPAVAEAGYQHVPLVVVSADRPAQWIDQQDGQTLGQPAALASLTECTVNLPEPATAEEVWFCNRLVNQALCAAEATHKPVHINVPISRPLYNFNVRQLGSERCITINPPVISTQSLHEIHDFIFQSACPLIVIGQYHEKVFSGSLHKLCQKVPCVNEGLAFLPVPITPVEVLMQRLPHHPEISQPTSILYLGGCVVSNALKNYLRQCTGAETWVLNPSAQIIDTFCSTTRVIAGDAADVLNHLEAGIPDGWSNPIAQSWIEAMADAANKATKHPTVRWSSLAVVQQLFMQLQACAEPWQVHLANSMAVRLGNLFARQPFWCNRGVNGIEGSLSTAAGMSVATTQKVLCVIGDLSFFYDQNALWNTRLRGNLRIVLLNNGGGSIFSKFKNLRGNTAREPMIMACHNTTAEGICHETHCTYLQAHNPVELKAGLSNLLHNEANRPMVLEAFTDIEIDEKEYEDFLQNEQI